MSYGIYVGRDLTLDGNAWLAGYGDEPSSHWLEITPGTKNKLGKSITVGVSETADMPGKRIKIPQVPHTYRFISVNYSCLLYTSPSPRDRTRSRMPSSA